MARRKYIEYDPKNGKILAEAVCEVNPNRKSVGFSNYIEASPSANTVGMKVDVDNLILIPDPKYRPPKNPSSPLLPPEKKEKINRIAIAQLMISIAQFLIMSFIAAQILLKSKGV